MANSITVYKVIKNSIIRLETGIESRAIITARSISADTILKVTKEEIKF